MLSSDSCLSCIHPWISLMRFAETKCRSLGGMKGTTPLEIFPLCMVSASLCCSNLFSASENCFQLPLLIRSIMSRKNLFVPTSVLISA